jgi:crotonobetainyl-CoA:carnitine CoA-transferase CaiB-like acyl-CoA transferase
MLQPLQGIRVLEWAIYHAGPGGPAILGDLGAEVIKIEQPKVGDPLRARTQFGRSYFEFKGKNLFFEGANRNKKSIILDLSKEEGREVAYRLAAKSDVFLTNIRQETVDKMKMGYPILHRINPRLIYASVTMFGPNGPDSWRGGFDYQGQARSGLMLSTGEPDMPPLITLFAVVDQVTAIWASHAVLSALVMRERFGIGQQVQLSILGSALGLQYFNVLIGALTSEADRHMRTDTDPLRNHYQCKGGNWICFTLPTLQPGLWEEFCQAIERPDLEQHPMFASHEKRMENSGELIAILDGIFLTKTREEWHDVLGGHGLLSSPVNSPNELKDDPQVMENKYIVEFDHPALGRVLFPGYPIHFSEAFAGSRTAAPELGEHTEEVLREIGGYSTEEIEQLREKEII